MLKGVVHNRSITLALMFLATCAHAQVLERLLPDHIPGYGRPFGVTLDSHARHPEATGIQLGSFAFIPELDLTEGYDSAPNGAPGSAVTTATPRLLVTDSLAGFAAFASSNIAIYPGDSSQNTAGLALAAGERAALPGQTITLSAGFLRQQETGFALDTIAISRPITFTLTDFRASDALSAGLFSLQPEVSATLYHFPTLGQQDRTDTREALTAAYLPGGPVQISVRLQQLQSNYREINFNSDTTQAIAGFMDKADGLWTFSALAGAAIRAPRVGPSLTGPVLEAGLDWMPTTLDQLRLTLAREIDDPDEVSATPYTLTQAEFSLRHQFPSEIFIKLSASAENAAYLNSNLRETLFTGAASLAWQLNPSLALTGAYSFNGRQANYLRAANEHILTLGVEWTP